MRGLCIAVLTGSLQACAGLTSAPSTQAEAEEGLVYFLPKKDVVFQVVVDGDGKSTVTVQSTAAYPDLGQAYVLQHRKSWIGTMDTKVAVGANGLLRTTSAESKPQVSEVLQAYTKAGVSMKAAKDQGACGAGTHVQIIELPGPWSGSLCGFTVTIKKRGALDAAKAAPTPATADPFYAGVYYRQHEPYLVDVRFEGSPYMQQIVLSPSGAPRRSLPVSRTLFAQSKADFGFEDGSPTQFDQTTQSELLAFLTIPADVMRAYFGAVGELFTNFKSVDENEAAALNARLKLELASKKYDACVEAIRTGNEAQAALLDCGK